MKKKIIASSLVVLGALALTSCGSGASGTKGLESLKGKKAADAYHLYLKTIPFGCQPDNSIIKIDPAKCDLSFTKLAKEYEQSFGVSNLDKKSILAAIPNLHQKNLSYTPDMPNMGK